MPQHYFFHCMDGFFDLDLEGTELADDATARRQAVVLLGEILQNEPEHVCNGQALRVRVTDDLGNPIFSVLTTAIIEAQKEAEKP